jgi:hypothetical protein
MAIKKVTTYDLQCEGPCKKRHQYVDKIPALWSKLKVTPVEQTQGVSPAYHVATLCTTCAANAIALLRDAGYTLTAVEGKK